MRRAAFPLYAGKFWEEEKETSSTLTRHIFEQFDSVAVPSSKSFHHEGVEVNALRTAIVKVKAAFGIFPHFYGGGGKG